MPNEAFGKVWAQCAVCGAPVCKVERCLFHGDGSEVEGGHWVCSSICFDYYSQSKDGEQELRIQHPTLDDKKENKGG